MRSNCGVSHISYDCARCLSFMIVVIVKGCDFMAYCIMRVEKIKTTSAGNARLKHNRREVDCVTANPEASKRNVKVTCSPEQKAVESMSFKDIFHARTSDQRVRSNAVHAIELMLTFSPGSLKAEDLKEWTRVNMEWVGKNFGGKQNIIDCRLHFDESTPHLHCIVIPIDERGRLNARAFLGGTRDRMSELQTSYAQDMECFGLERGISRTITKAQHQDYKRHIAELAEREGRLRAYEALFGDESTFDLDTYSNFMSAKSEPSERLGGVVERERSQER